MTHLQIRREAGVWAVLLDGQDIKSGVAGLSLETDQHRPQDPPTVVIRYRPDRLDVDIDAAELVEVPHEHDWLEVTDFKDRSQNERHYVCDGCPKQRSVREVIQAGECATCGHPPDGPAPGQSTPYEVEAGESA